MDGGNCLSPKWLYAGTVDLHRYRQCSACCIWQVPSAMTGECRQPDPDAGLPSSDGNRGHAQNNLSAIVTHAIDDARLSHFWQDLNRNLCKRMKRIWWFFVSTRTKVFPTFLSFGSLVLNPLWLKLLNRSFQRRMSFSSERES